MSELSKVGTREVEAEHGESDESVLLVGIRDGILGRGFCPGNFAGNLDAAKAIHVAGDAAIERFSNALAVLGGFKLVLIRRITDKRDLRQNGGHIRAN